MKVCKRCGTQLLDHEIVCPLCKENNSREDEKSEVFQESEEVIKETVVKKKFEKINVNEPPHPVEYKDIGSRSQVAISFSDGSIMCLRKAVARSLYPQLFVVSEGDD